MNKTEYIKAHPKSTLAANLLLNSWPDDTLIIIVGGLDAIYNKTSNLYKATNGAEKEVCRGGHRQRGTEGWWWAVRK